MGSAITFEQKGDYSKTTKWLNKIAHSVGLSYLDKYGREGVKLLQNATPKDSGETANSWRYEVEVNKKCMRLDFINDNVNNGVPIAILIQYGHATRNGGFVEGIDYINPTLKPIFNELAEKVWKEVVDE